MSVRSVTRAFEPVRVRRIETAFALLGGIVPGGDSGPEEDDELDEDEGEFRDPAGRATVALHSVSFEAVGGSCVAIVGPGLSGKSLLMRVLAGHVPPTSGQVVIRGRVAPALLSSLRVFPRYGRVKGTLPSFAALIGIPPRVARSHFLEIAEFAGSPAIGRQHVRLLSKAERWALTLSLALHADADVILVDPPPPSGPFGDACRSRLIELKRAGRLVIVTARTAESVSWIADRAIELRDGAVVADTTIDPSRHALSSSLA